MTDEKVETSHSTSRVFKVEARVRPNLLVTPVDTGTQILDERWRQIRVEQGPIGVPSLVWCAEMKQRGYLSYESAMALAYWFLAGIEQSSVEVRLVEYEGVVDVRITRKSELEPIGNYSYDFQRRTLSQSADAVAGPSD